MTKARDLANVISGSGVLAGGVIPDLPASKITSGTIASARLSLSASDIPNLDTAKITSGTFADARLSSSSVTQHVDLTALSASNLTSGTVPSARLSLSASDIPNLATSKITSGTFADALFAASNITQHVDLSNLNASNLTSGSIPNARVPSGAVTQHVSAVANTSGSWTPSPSAGGFYVQTARYQKVGNMCMAVAQGYWNSQTPGNTTVFKVNGLPFTSANVGLNVGSGTFKTFRMSGKNPQVLIKPNETAIRLYGDGAYYNESSTNYSSYPNVADQFIVFSNWNFYEVSQGQANEDGWFLWVIYQTAS